MLWSHTAKRHGHTKINQKVREPIFHFILHHTQFVIDTIENDCLYVSIDGNCDLFLMKKLLLQVYVQELHNSMVSCPEEGGPK